MSIAENISRINNAKISMIEAIQSNIDIDLPSGLKIHQLAPYITSACQVRYQAGVIAGGGASSSSSSGESGGGTLALVATGGSGGPAVLNGDWYDSGDSTSVSENSYPIYTHTNGNNTYYLQRVHSNYENSDLWTVTTSPIQSSEWNGWMPSPYEASVIYSWTNSNTPVGCEWYVGSSYNYDAPVAPTFSAVGGESSSSSESGGVSFPSTVYVTSSSVAGTYTQTGSYETVNGINYPVYSNGSFYYMFEYDRWKFFSSYPPMSGPYYQADSATTEMVTTYTDGPMSEGSPYPVVSLTPASNAYPDALIVSDAMTSNCNGVYNKTSDERQGKPIYRQPNSPNYIIAYDYGYWYIADSTGMISDGMSYYYGSSLTGSYSQGNYGAGPGCTVAEYSGGESSSSSESGGGGSFPSVVYVTNTPGTSSVAGTYNQTEYSTTVVSVNYPVYSNGSFYLVFESDRWKIFSSYPAESGPYYQQISAGTDMTAEYTGGPMDGGTPYPVVSLTPASNVYPDALTVSDARTSGINGTYYKLNDTCNNKPVYGNNQSLSSSTKVIAYVSGNWRIMDDLETYDMGGGDYYHSSSLTGDYDAGNFAVMAQFGCRVDEDNSGGVEPASSSSESLGTITATDRTINGTAYVSIGEVSLQASASNGATCTFSGSLPNGLSMTSAGVITGRVETSSAINTSYQIEVSADGCTSTTLTLTVQISLGTINIDGSPQISGTAGSQITSVYLTNYASASNGQSCTFSGNMPSGLSLSGGVISGTPTNAVNSTYNITVSANGCTSNTIYVSINIQEQSGGNQGGGSGCVLKGTKIALADGTEKNVEDITYDDNLLVWDFDNGCLASAKPAWLCHYGKTDYCWRTDFSNGTTLYVMGPKDLARSHRALSIEDGEFIYLQDIVGKEVATLSGTTALLSCEKEQCDTEYFNIVTEYHLNFFANGILTSCRLSNIAKIEDMKYVEHSESDIDYSDIPEYYVRTLRLKEQKTDMHDYMNSNIIPLALPRKVESPCFLKGTKLTLADGTTKNIEDITYEDELLTWDFDEGKPSAQKPEWIYRGYTNYYSVVEFSNGTTMRVTGDSNGNTHRLYDVVNGSFNYVNTMLGHEVITENGDKVTVDSYEIVDENVNEEYYNIITEHDYNYYINGILASCSLNNKLYSVDESMKYVKREAKSISHPALDGVVSEKDYKALRVSELPTSVDDYIISVVNSKFHK